MNSPDKNLIITFSGTEKWVKIGKCKTDSTPNMQRHV